MPKLTDALALARAGWAVIPLNGKVPLTAHGVKDATTDETLITAWWSQREPNIGARVPDAFVVLDVDPQNGGSFAELEALAGVQLPETLTVISGRMTGGQHRYYAHPGGQLSQSQLPKGIDVKTATGYCVMPPSLHPATGKPYVWNRAAPAHLPPEVVALMRPKSAPSRPLPELPADRSAVLERKAFYLAQYVSGQAEGQRNAGLFWAACRAVEDGHPQATLDLLEGAATAAGLTPREAERTIESARRATGGNHAG